MYCSTSKHTVYVYKSLVTGYHQDFQLINNTNGGSLVHTGINPTKLQQDYICDPIKCDLIKCDPIPITTNTYDEWGPIRDVEAVLHLQSDRAMLPAPLKCQH